jgi:hypothetical protein
MNRFLVVLSSDEIYREHCDPEKLAGYVEFLESGERLPFHSSSELDLILRFFRDNSPQETH